MSAALKWLARSIFANLATLIKKFSDYYALTIDRHGCIEGAGRVRVEPPPREILGMVHLRIHTTTNPREQNAVISIALHLNE